MHFERLDMGWWPCCINFIEAVLSPTIKHYLLCDKLLNNECKHKLTHKLFKNARWPSQQQLSATCLLLLRSTSPVYIWIRHKYMLGTKFTFPGWRESDPIGKLCASDLLSVRSMRKMVNIVLALFPCQRSWQTQEKQCALRYWLASVSL